MLANFCWAVPLMPPIEVPKAPQKVIERAKAGLEQELIVEFEHHDITEKINRKRLSVGAMFDREEDTIEKQKEYALLRAKIFPNGRLGDARVITEYKNLPLALVHVSNAQALEKLLSHKHVASISENLVLYPALTESLPLIGQPIAIANGKNGAGTKVAVLDSGVDWGADMFATNPNTKNFGCRKYGTFDSLVGTADCKISEIISFTGTNDSGFDLSATASVAAHGTTVAGIVSKVAPGAKIAVLQVFYKSTIGLTTTAAIVNKAVDWVISNAKTSNIVAMNLSLGTTAPYATSECSLSKFSSSFLEARSKGVLPVVSSGNEGNKTQLPEPACAVGAVRVGAVFDANIGEFNWPSPPCSNPTTAADMVPCFSNSNATLTLLAPGAFIWANGTYRGAGTSEAAPHVAGAIAVLRAPNAFPNETLDGTVNRMKNSGIPVKDPRNGIITPRLNLAAALKYIPGPLSSPYIPTVQAIVNDLLLNGE